MSEAVEVSASTQSCAILSTGPLMAFPFDKGGETARTA